MHTEDERQHVERTKLPKLTRRALAFRDQLLPILLQGKVYDDLSHQVLPVYTESGKRATPIDALKQWWSIKVSRVDEAERRAALLEEVKVARVGMSSLFITEVMSELPHFMEAKNENDSGLVHYHKRKIQALSSYESLSKEAFLSRKPQEAFQLLRFSMAETIQKLLGEWQKMYEQGRPINKNLLPAYELYEFALLFTVQGDTSQVGGTPESHLRFGMNTAVNEGLALAELIGTKLAELKADGRKITRKQAADILMNNYPLFRQMAQMHMIDITAEVLVLHRNGDEDQPYDRHFFSFVKDDSLPGGYRVEVNEAALAQAAPELSGKIFGKDYLTGVTGCPAMLADSEGSRNAVEGIVKLIMQKAIELYLPTLFPEDE